MKRVSVRGRSAVNWCELISAVCRHNAEVRLDMLVIGHNPSEHAWKSGNMYSNPTNRMWKILTGTLDPSDHYPVSMLC